MPDLQQAIQTAYRADFSVGYFNLRGWEEIASKIDSWPGGDRIQDEVEKFGVQGKLFE